MTEIYPNIYMKVIDFQDKNMSPRNLYVIKQEKRSLMVDTAYRTPECLDIIDEMLKELEIPYSQLDVFITHIHPDHAGLAEEMSAKGATIYMNPAEADSKNDLMHCYLSNSRMRNTSLRTIGVTKEHTPDVYHTVMEYTEEQFDKRLGTDIFKFIPIEQGEIMRYGDFSFKVIGLRGHTYGQLGLYDKQHKIFFCGDQVMTTIAPIVGSMHKDMALLEYYMSSLEIIKNHFKDYLVLSSHYDIIRDVGKEVDRIVHSYIDKCDIMRHTLENHDGEMTIRQVGVYSYGRTEEPPDKKMFLSCAMIWAKTFSCLEYLYEEGFVDRVEREGILYWTSIRHNPDS